MHRVEYFKYKEGTLYCEDVNISSIAEEYGTPLYVYSYSALTKRFFQIKSAFREVSPLICYSVKANSSLSILKAMVENGAGLDIVSGGELYRAKLVNCFPGKIVYASVGKTAEEIKEAIQYGILMFNVESEPELEKINFAAGALKRKVGAALRINPDVKPNTHKYITTGEKENKFGIDIDSAHRIFLNRKKYNYLNIAGIHIHIGSQITSAAPFVKAIKKIKVLNERLRAKKIFLKYFNIGGGLGIIYNKENLQTVEEFAQRVLPLLKEIGLRVILEPGRFIAGNSGIMVTKVLYVKDTPHKRFIIVDSAMNDLLRPSLYGAYHKIIPVRIRAKDYRAKTKPADVVGPVCESGDFLGKGRKLNVKGGDCLAVLSAGAYGFSMSSNYNSRKRAAEVLVRGNKYYLIRKRENYHDLVRKEIIASV